MRRRSRKYFVAALLCFNIFIWWDVVERSAIDGPPPIAVDLFNSHPDLPDFIRGVGEGKERSLHLDYTAVHGRPYSSRFQGNAPSCVGQSAACALDFLAAVEIRAGHRNLPPPPRASASWIYGASRELGGINFRGGGSYCRLAVRSMKEQGFLYERDYWYEDIRGDNPSRDREFGRELPEALRHLATSRITGYYKLHSYADVRDAIYSGYPVITGSHVGFGNPTCERDSDGFLRSPWLIVRGGRWNHAMAFIGFNDVGRKGVLCQNSWGKYWISGPKRSKSDPDGSFWIDKKNVDRMVKFGDTFAIYGLSP